MDSMLQVRGEHRLVGAIAPVNLGLFNKLEGLHGVLQRLTSARRGGDIQYFTWIASSQ